MATVKRALAKSAVDAKKFMDELVVWVAADTARLRSLLLPILLNNDSGLDTSKINHMLSVRTASVIRILLLDVDVPGLQTMVIDWLVDSLCMCIDNEDTTSNTQVAQHKKKERNDKASISNQSNPTTTINTAKLILNQLRWLDYCEDPTNLALRLLDALPALSYDCKVDLISSLTEMIPDSEQELVTVKLITLLDNEPQLMLPILDALSNLTMDVPLKTNIITVDVNENVINQDVSDAQEERNQRDRMEQPRHHVGIVEDHVAHVVDIVLRNAILSVDVQDIPAVVRYLMNVARRDNVEEIVRRTRKSLDLPALFKSSDNIVDVGTIVANRYRRVVQFPAGLLLEEIRTAMRRHRHVYMAWVKLIETLDTQVRHTSFDIIMLLLLYTVSPATQKDAQRLFRSKIFNNLITSQQLADTIATHRTLFQHTRSGTLDLANVVVSLAEVLLRAKRVTKTGSCAGVLEFVRVLYCSTFEALDDAYYRQEVIASLVTHIGSGSAAEVDGALHILLDITKRDPVAVNGFAIFVRGLLDYLDNLNLSQVRLLIEILTCLGFLHNDSRARAQNGVVSDMIIVIKKQLRSTLVHHKKIGCIGALAMAAQFGARKLSTWSSVEDAEQSFSEASELIYLTRECCMMSVSTLSLFYNELARLVLEERLHPDLETVLMDTYMCGFISGTLLLHELEDSANDGNGDVYTITDPSTESEQIQGLLLAHLAERKRATTGSSSEYAVLPFSDNTTDNDINQAIMQGGQGGFVDTHVLHIETTERSTIYFNILGNLYVPLMLGGQTLDPLTRTYHPCAVMAPLLRLMLCFNAKRSELFADFPLLGGTSLLEANLIIAALPDGKVISSYTDIQKTVLCSSFVYGLSVIKELLNAFSMKLATSTTSTPASRKLWRSLCQRIKLCIELESRLHTAIAYAPPAFCPLGFEYEQSIKNASRGRGHGANNVMTDEVDYKVKGKGRGNGVRISRSSINSAQAMALFVRDLDLSVYNIFAFAQRVSERQMVTESQQANYMIEYDILRFLILDLLKKLRYKLRNSSKTIGAFEGESQLDGVSEVVVVRVVIDNISFLCETLERISNDIQRQTEASSMQPENITANQLVMAVDCFESIVRCLNEVLEWESLTIGSNREMFFTLLHRIAARHQPIEGAEREDINHLLESVMTYFGAFKDTLNVLHLAVLLCQLLDVLAQFSDVPADYKDQLHAHVASVLGHEWREGEKKTEHIEYLVTQELKLSADPIARVHEYVCNHFQTLISASNDPDISLSQLAKNPLLNNTTLYSFYKTCFKVFNSAMASNPFQTLLIPQNVVDRSRQIAQAFVGLMALVKQYNSKLFVKTALREGTRLVQSFIVYGCPALNHVIRVQRDDVFVTVRLMQQGTRQLQNICGHSKTLMDKSLLDQVPRTRAILEKFVYAAREMLVENRLTSAWYTGNLKHRDIQGQIVSSQLARNESESSSLSSSEESNPDGNQTRPISSGHSKVHTGTSKISKRRTDTNSNDRQLVTRVKITEPTHNSKRSKDSKSESTSQTSKRQKLTTTTKQTTSGLTAPSSEPSSRSSSRSPPRPNQEVSSRGTKSLGKRTSTSSAVSVPHLAQGDIEHSLTIMPSDAEIEDEEDDDDDDESKGAIRLIMTQSRMQVNDEDEEEGEEMEQENQGNEIEDEED